MYISARERKILEILLNREDGTTVKELAKEMGVSSRTVHRDIKGVEDLLRKNGLQLDKSPGVGIKVIGEEKNRKELYFLLFNLSHSEYTTEERQTMILIILFEATDPVKLQALANDLNVTIATISNDLDKIEEQVRPYGIHLIRKRGYGVEITGSESAKRRAMSNLLLKNLAEYEFLSVIKESLQKKPTGVTDRLLGLVDKKKLLKIEELVAEINNELPYPIADSAYIGLVVHLALAVERILQGENIIFDPEILKSMEETKEFQIAHTITKNLEKIFEIEIPYAEIGYITMHLMGAKLRNDKDSFFEDDSLQVGVKAQRLIHYVGEKKGQDLSKNSSLYQGLVAHLRPAIYRMKQNMGISNPLLEKIESDYHELFTIIESGVASIFPEFEVPKEEIGYLVMHFGSALLKEEELWDRSALVICSSGIGTSKMLASKLQKEIPTIKEIKNISVFDLKLYDLNEFDIVISTIPIKDFPGKYILASPLPSEEELEKIRSILHHTPSTLNKELESGKRRKKPSDSKYFLARVDTIQKLSKAIYAILKQFQLKPIIDSLLLESILELACNELSEQKLITNPLIVVDELLAREKVGGVGIPETSLGLYHTKSSSVLAPIFTIYRTDQPIIINAMDDTKIEMDTLLLMLSPHDVDDETNEVLSFISSLLIQNEESTRLFETKDGNEIINFLTEHLEEFFEEKIDGIRSV
ncbi:BglG family transcription antiterminator [Ferdinandcohnia quinoae]|uniref:BglG family transcription antiterminator n=1 Tax=Fredinandcohnia quinoae TaxID=2918902 RepID=A0AAW5EBM0_9BACI|nr:BglG family transcription antiterminator [Fredinandcohnia sp. SECRCQ15]MCH1627441.1 BglG family transcription antiterminator [Fredinandcohnia sp. SECRCQ15]